MTGYPSGDKRLTFLQMEGLTGFAAKDEWDFKNLGITNEPFIKANYPHHEGTWGWEKQADQVVLVVRNIRRSLVEYSDILWDIQHAKTWEEANLHLQDLYRERPPLEDFIHWRDIRVMDEIQWYGWFIDYWMEGGLLRDMFSKRITTQKHWNMLMRPDHFHKDLMTYELIVGNETVTPTYDPHCLTDVSGGCPPVEVISAERLVEHDTGPAENLKIAQVLTKTNNMTQHMIPEDAWECVWTELIVNKKGLKTFLDREGITERDYNFSEEMLEKMIVELDYLITKYGGSDWNTLATAQTLVELLSEHRELVQQELVEVQTGVRKLKNDDFLGPIARARREKEIEDKHLYWADETD